MVGFILIVFFVIASSVVLKSYSIKVYEKYGFNCSTFLSNFLSCGSVFFLVAVVSAVLASSSSSESTFFIGAGGAVLFTVILLAYNILKTDFATGLILTVLKIFSSLPTIILALLRIAGFGMNVGKGGNSYSGRPLTIKGTSHHTEFRKTSNGGVQQVNVDNHGQIISSEEVKEIEKTKS